MQEEKVTVEDVTEEGEVVYDNIGFRYSSSSEETTNVADRQELEAPLTVDVCAGSNGI